MEMTTQPFDFDNNPDFVAQYDRGPPMFMPGYAASHVMAATVLIDRIGPDADVLIVGAGGGIEIAAFARLCPGWRYVAVDPSQAMLDLAAARFSREQPDTQVKLIKGVADDAPAGPFDAATAFLCLFFVPDDGTRLAQLKAIHARLKPGAPFLMIHTAAEPERRATHLTRYGIHARLSGAEEDLIEKATAMQDSQVHILTPDREADLLREAGFTLNGMFYQGLWVRGWEATA